MPKQQIGARYLHRQKTRKDQSFIGIVKLVNNPRTIKLSSGAIKRISSQRAQHA